MLYRRLFGLMTVVLMVVGLCGSVKAQAAPGIFHQYPRDTELDNKAADTRYHYNSEFTCADLETAISKISGSMWYAAWDVAMAARESAKLRLMNIYMYSESEAEDALYAEPATQKIVEALQKRHAANAIYMQAVMRFMQAEQDLSYGDAEMARYYSGPSQIFKDAAMAAYASSNLYTGFGTVLAFDMWEKIRETYTALEQAADLYDSIQ